MHRALALLLVALVPLAGGIDTAQDDAPLEATALPAAAQPAAGAPSPCVPVLEARPAPEHVALAWTPCAGATSYQLLRGASLDALAPLVEVNHAGHVDIAPLAVGYYAVRAGDGALSAPVVVAMG